MKRILLSVLVVIISITVVYAFVYYAGVEGFSFAVALNFILMACAAIFTETLKSPLSSPYFDVKEWERKGEIYEILGVNFYRKILVWIGWEKLNKKAKPVGKGKDVLIDLHYQSKQDELAHLIIFIIVLAFNIYVAIEYGFLASTWLLSLNILLNLYPIFLQRFNRPRIERILSFIEKR